MSGLAAVVGLSNPLGVAIASTGPWGGRSGAWVASRSLGSSSSTCSVARALATISSVAAVIRRQAPTMSSVLSSASRVMYLLMRTLERFHDVAAEEMLVRAKNRRQVVHLGVRTRVSRAAFDNVCELQDFRRDDVDSGARGDVAANFGRKRELRPKGFKGGLRDLSLPFELALKLLPLLFQRRLERRTTIDEHHREAVFNRLLRVPGAPRGGRARRENRTQDVHDDAHLA